MNLRELCVALPLLILAIWFGVYPMTVLRYMDKTIDAQVEQLAGWSERYVAEQSAQTVQQTDRGDQLSRVDMRPVQSPIPSAASTSGRATSGSKRPGRRLSRGLPPGGQMPAFDVTAPVSVRRAPEHGAESL